MTTAEVARSRGLWIGLRIATPLAILAAVLVTLDASRDFWADEGYVDVATLWVNFFSYFTILSNLAALVVLAVGAMLLLRHTRESGAWSVVRVSVAVYMGITGVVYNLLLRGIEVTGSHADVPDWPNEVLHVIAPLVVLLDWLLAPGRHPIAWRRIWTVLAFPILWAAYTLIRGPHTADQIAGGSTWYPYPFLDPDNGGYLAVSAWVVVIAAAFTGMAALLIWPSRRSAAAPLTAGQAGSGGPAEHR